MIDLKNFLMSENFSHVIAEGTKLSQQDASTVNVVIEMMNDIIIIVI
jgi:hypothetical protein